MRGFRNIIPLSRGDWVTFGLRNLLGRRLREKGVRSTDMPKGED
jgi:hypothetical protein